MFKNSLEGIKKDLSIANLVYIMKTLLTEILEREVEVRLRPGFFPFVEIFIIISSLSNKLSL